MKSCEPVVELESQPISVNLRVMCLPKDNMQHDDAGNS